MSDWVHCNKCALKYNAQATFFLVECGHIVCHRCVESIRATKRCIICNKTSNILLLDKNIEPRVLEFFTPVETSFKKTMEVYKFQLQHRSSLLQHITNKYNYAKKEYISCYNSNKHLMKENQMLRSMLRSAGKNPQQFLTSTPISQFSENNITPQNTSLLSSIPPSIRNNPMMKTFPGYPKRHHIFSSGSSQGQSSVQRVPYKRSLPQEPVMIHRDSIGAMRSLEELRRSNKSQ